MEKIRPIQKLSPQVIGQIAAGEVVERPASAVKELVENSIDAGATAVTVELREGGIAYLRVTDNGRGIPASQIRMAFERHATSKILRSEDLFDVHTLGFRGEALASIAAVSKVTCTTRTAQEDFGVRAQVDGGVMGEVREAAMPVGTTILVKDLFYNTPVRLRFLKKPVLEASMVTDYMTRLILSRPDISFRYVNEGKTIYQSAGDGSLESALLCCYGKDSLKAMHRVQGNENGILVEGYVGVGELARGNRQQQSFFVNGRYFKDEGLSKAVENACLGLVMIGRFPSCALYLQLPYDKVDVNVHPNKLEVRFQNPGAVAGAVEVLARQAVSRQRLGDVLLAGWGAKTGVRPEPPQETIRVVALKEEEGQPDREKASQPQEGTGTAGEASAAPQEGASGAPAQPDTSHLKPAILPPRAGAGSLREDFGVLRPQPMPASSWPSGPAGGFAPSAAPRPPISSVPAAPVRPSGEIPPAAPPALEPVAPDDPAAPNQEEARQQSLLQEEKTPPLRLLGIAFQTYLLFEAGERLLWVDQHAAHERILFDKFWKRYEGERISQRLLSPQLVPLPAQERMLLKEWQPLLTEAGFEVQPFDDTAVAVHAIPTLFGVNEPAGELLLEALDACQSGRGPLTQERMRRQVAQMACKRAIKAGDRLSDAEIQSLLKTMLETGVLPTCPHGRPIVVEVSRRELEKRFKRIP
ncbi:MAG: DNA mismatch repair endonuclease MutL [Candidatus Limiplasma sp.]|nr:DNA mismatch repair endonuclease MutL [Candidatus Limiplasma sp.]